MQKLIKERLTSAVHALVRQNLVHRKDLAHSLWGLEYLSGNLSFNGKPLEDAVKEWGTPLHLYFEQRLKANLEGFQAPGCEVFLSYKTNPVPKMLGFLHGLGAGAEVISEYELWLALSLGVPPDRIIYNGPAKSDRSLAQAIKRGILLINLNHQEEIPRIRSIAQSLGKRVSIGIRVTGNGWAGQFGFSLGDGSALNAIETVLKIPDFDLVGLHCHRGISIRTQGDLDHHIGPILDLCQHSYQKWGWAPRILDVGGSLAIPTVRYYTEMDRRLGWALGLPPAPPNPDDAMKPKDFAASVSGQIRAAAPRFGGTLPRIVLEPGRSLTGNAQLVVTRVVDVRRAKPMNFAILDAGSCHGRIMESEFHQIFPLTKAGHLKEGYRLVGPICHTGDFLSRAWFGEPLSAGDLLAVMDSGAYFIADSAAFSFPRAGVAAFTMDGQWQLARGVEDFSQMVALDQVDSLKQASDLLELASPA